MSWSYRFRRPLPAQYQFDTLRKALRRKRLGVFFEQRVGKTRVAVDFCGVLNAKFGLQKFLVVCPKSVLTVWPEAIEQYWSGPKCEISMLQPATHPKPTFVIVNYDQLRLRWKEFKGWRPDAVILDEVQYCLSHTSQRSKSVHKIADLTKYVLGLTGTPGKPERGWFGIMRAIDSGVYGKHFAPYERKYLNSSHSRGYFEMLGSPKDLDSMYFRREELESKFREASVRVTREDAGIVDDFEDITVPVDLEPKIKQIYRKLDKDSYLDLNVGELTAGIVLTRDMRLHQLAGGFMTLDDETVKRVSRAKFDKCVELTNDLLDDDKQVIIICKFTPEIKVLATEFVDKRHIGAVISGESTNTQRKAILEAFQRGEIKVLIAQQRAIAEGLDLTAAHNMIFFSVDFSLTLYKQVRDRVAGRAQKHHITYWHLAAKGTVDKDIYRALQTDENIVDALVNRNRKEE